MSKGKKIVLFIISSVLFVMMLFGCLSIYAAFSYVNRTVKAVPKNEITEIELGKTYSVHDFFDFERGDSTMTIYMEVTGSGITDMTVDEEADTFCINEGSGSVTIGASALNSDSPECNQKTVTVDLVE